MIKVSKIKVFNFEGAVRGMRNPMNSWNKSDSYWCNNGNSCYLSEHKHCLRDWMNGEPFFCVGKNDLDLMHRLYKGGTEHRKFMRQIIVSMDITAPLYWWKEFDTYKVGTTANSTSTMHKIMAKEFTLDDFSTDQLIKINRDFFEDSTIRFLNKMRDIYLSFEKDENNKEIKLNKLHRDEITGEIKKVSRNYTVDKKTIWWQIIQFLPSSYNQTRTVTMNYENAVAMIKQRTNHKLDEWNEFVKILRDLPFLEEIINGEEISRETEN